MHTDAERAGNEDQVPRYILGIEEMIQGRRKRGPLTGLVQVPFVHCIHIKGQRAKTTPALFQETLVGMDSLLRM